MDSLTRPTLSERMFSIFGLSADEHKEHEAAMEEFNADLYSYEEPYGETVSLPHDHGYRGFALFYDPPPIPDRNNDWRFYNPLREDEQGTAESEASARAAIDEFIAER